MVGFQAKMRKKINPKEIRNVSAKTRRNPNFKVRLKMTHTNYSKFSFFNCYITDWKSIPSNSMHAPSFQQV